MKTIIAVIMLITITCFALASCGESLKRDDNHATVSVTTSSGGAFVGKSFNGAGYNRSGKDMALKNKMQVTLKNGDIAHITFKCDSCEDTQEYDIKEAWADVLSCNCTEAIDENGNAKEYYAISISFEE